MNSKSTGQSYNQWPTESAAARQQLPNYLQYTEPLKESAASAPSSSKAPSKLHSLVLRRTIEELKKQLKAQKPSRTASRHSLTLKLVSRITNLVRTVLEVNRDGVAQKCNQQEARNRLREIEPEIPEKERREFLKLLREARDHPISAKNQSTWTSLLTEFVLITDPKLKRYPELKKLKSAKYIKGEGARNRYILSKVFGGALKNLWR